MFGLSRFGAFGEIIAEVGPLEKVVLVILFVLSVVSWAIILHKALQFRLITGENARFLKLYRESRRFSLVGSGAKRLRQSPLARVYLGAYQELTAAGGTPPDMMDGGPEPTEESISPERLESIQRAMRRVQASEIERMERYLAFLATTASAGPFVGLFGTVVGIMNSFKAIGAQGSASLAVVAPGISGALVATAFGLGAAIPAVIGYNYFVGRVRRVVTEMDNFALELANLIERRLVRSTKPF
jgi:biopolymer transport protein TolQ